MYRKLGSLAALWALVIALGLGGCAFWPERSLVLATTTSTYDSGLLDAILPAFEEEHNVKVSVVAVGTGQALALAARGDVDVVLVHAPDREIEFVRDGFGVNRKYVMYNDFVILGPEDDPAGIRGLNDAADAFRRISAMESTFVSRGDESGTHIKEVSLWASAGVGDLENREWRLSVGQGMGGTLTTANEKGAYTLSDRGTFLAREDLDLVILAEGDEVLFNPYHVVMVNPERFPSVQAELVTLFIEFLVKAETQRAIGEFGKEKYGQGLFTPVNLEE